jgi:hypothetical protein
MSKKAATTLGGVVAGPEPDNFPVLNAADKPWGDFKGLFRFLSCAPKLPRGDNSIARIYVFADLDAEIIDRIEGLPEAIR